jgi:hypothetical protein
MTGFRGRHGSLPVAPTRQPAAEDLREGSVVVFESTASNLATAGRGGTKAADENLLSDVYAFDRHTESFARVSGGPDE